MRLIIKLLAIWGIADSLFMTLRPKQWSGFWGVIVSEIGNNGTYARTLGAAQMAVCLYLMKRK